MQHSYSFLLKILTISSFILLSSCNARERENPTSVSFLVDNQSTFTLYYDRGSGLDFETVQLDPNDIKEIEEVGTDFGGFLTAEEYFVTDRDTYIGTDESSILYRDSAGVRIEALRLDLNESLNWDLDVVDESTHAYTLTVTDDMIN